MAGFGFVEVADETMEGETQHVDEAILLALRDPNNHALAIGPSWMEPVMHDISALGGVAIVSLMLLAVSGLLLLERKYRMMVFMASATIGGTVGMLLLKSFFQRPRPDVVPHLTDITQTSFPSGHSMVSAVVYLTLAVLLAKSTTSRKLKAYFLFLGITTTVLVGFSRVYLGVHYPTDVLAGWCAGAAWASVCYLIAEWLQRRGNVEEESPGVNVD